MKLFDFLCQLSKYFAAKENIPCVLRNYALLPYDNIGNDIDLLFPEATNTIIKKALTEIPEVKVTGYCSRYYVLSLFLHGIEWGQNNAAIQIDIIKHLCWKGIPYININNVVKNSVYLSTDCKWICRPQPHYEAIISFFSSYLVGGWINDKYQEQVRRIFTERQKEVFHSLCEYLPQSISLRMIRNVISDNRATLMADLRTLRYSLVWCAFKKNPVEAMVRVWRYYIAEISILFFAKRFRTDVCVLGPDGSGKTTLINNITIRLRNSAKVIEYKHFRPRMRIKSGSGKPVDNPHQHLYRPAWISALKLCYFIFVYNFDRWFRLNKSRNFVLRIWDRHYLDMLADPRRYRMGAPAWLVRRFGRLIPKPDLFLILDVTPDVARARKAEVSEQESLRQFEAYRALARELPNAMLIDANVAPEAVAAQCERAIVEAMSLRLQRRGVAA